MKTEIKTAFETIIKDLGEKATEKERIEFSSDAKPFISKCMSAAYNLALIDASEVATILQHNIVTGIPESKSHTSNLLGKIIVDKQSILDLKIL